MNLFNGYRYINAEEIIRANIRPNSIGEDCSSLLNALLPVTYIAIKESPKAAQLHRNVIQKLNPKRHTLTILKPLGYELTAQGDYVYQSVDTDEEITTRENAVEEFQRFYNDLKKIKTGTLNGFKEYLEGASNRPQSQTQNQEVGVVWKERLPEQTTSAASFRPSSPTRMPDYQTVQRNNERTAATIREFKEMIKPKHNGRVAHSFIRRKLLFRLFQQKFPEATEVDDQTADSDIDRRIGDLRREDKNPIAGSADEVYYECLLRTNFNESKALEMLRHNRPNMQAPPEPEIPRGPTTTTLDTSLPCIQRQWLVLTNIANEDDEQQILVQEGDEWKNTVHVVTAITELRQQFNNPEGYQQLVNRMYRLLFSELSQIVGAQSPLKMEILADALCEAPLDSVMRLYMVDIRDIVLSCSDTGISDHFREDTMRALSTECQLCMDTFPRSHMETMLLCTHTCCLDCAKEYYRGAVARIKDSQSLKTLTCFAQAHDITDDVKMNFLSLLGTKMNQWFTDERRVLDLYHENLYMATRDSKDKKCGNPRCLGFFYNDNNQVARAQCPHCQFYQCQQCCRKWNAEHSKMLCEQYAEWLRDNDPDDPEVQLMRYLNTAGMVCPNDKCKAVYEYQAGGCEHFRCPKCKTEFCRICSALFYNPQHNTVCPRPNCTMKKTLHAHCYLNCYREIRDATVEEITQLLTARKINFLEELRQKPLATGPKCPVEGCQKAASVTSENHFCETCYKQFLCLLVWRNQFEPWELYTDNNLRQKLTNESVTVPANATKAALIVLAQQHLAKYLGKPKKIERRGAE